jgi:Fe-S oxidoreductase
VPKDVPSPSSPALRRARWRLEALRRREKINEAIGFPGALVEDWQAKAPSARWASCWASTARCGLSGRLRALRRLHRQVPLFPRHRRPEEHAGGPPGPDAQRLPPPLHAGRQAVPEARRRQDLTRELLDDWYKYYHQCSECRRCSVFCPYGIDTAEITMAGREILDSVGYGQKYSNEIIGKVHKIGNNLGLPGPALEDTLLRAWRRTSRKTPAST